MALSASEKNDKFQAPVLQILDSLGGRHRHCRMAVGERLAWDSAKADAKTLSTQFETKQEAHLKAPAGSPEATQAVTVEMSKLTCIAANSFYSANWQVSVPYRGKLIQAFVWHGYGAEIPSAQSIKERGCGETADGKYQFRGS